MNKFISFTQKIYTLVNNVFNQFINKRTTEFVEQYQLHHNEMPSDLRISKFRKDYVLKNGLLLFLFTTLLFFGLT